LIKGLVSRKSLDLGAKNIFYLFPLILSVPFLFLGVYHDFITPLLLAVGGVLVRGSWTCSRAVWGVCMRILNSAQIAPSVWT